MTSVPLGRGAFNRTFAQEPEIDLLNRFFEENPTNQVEGAALLARPGDTFFTSMGVGPIRLIAHQPGVHNGDLFVVSGDTLFRFDGTILIAISGTITGSAVPSITFVAGPGFQHLFISDGATLQFYDGEAAAKGTLTVSGGNIVATDVVEMDGVHYEYTAGSVDLGTPLGTLADPFLVALGASDTDALANLVKALNNSGTPGTDYSTAITAPHTTVEGVQSDATTMDVAARTRGTGGNSITTTETGVNIAWGAVTLEGGGAQSLNGVVTPDDVAIVSLATLNSFVIAVVANSQRFFWLQPAAITIDALDFAEAEAEPDEIIQVLRIGDSLYFLGQSFTEVWYATGDDLDPFLRQQGLAFSQGTLAGTAVAIRTQISLIAEDGIAYQIAGGPQRFSNHGIEERIRKAQKALG